MLESRASAHGRRIRPTLGARPASLREVRTIPVAKIPVRAVLERYEIVPRKRFGQNFLHDPAVCARIVATADVSAGTEVLEVGPGLGALTVPLLALGARVTAVEVDRRVANYLDDAFADEPGFRLHRGDFLDLDLATFTPEARVLVANMPYSITGPILSGVIEHAARWDRCVLMVQKEVGTRLTASAGGKALGAPAVLLRLLYRIERCFDVGRGAFLPPPDVVSVVLRLTRIPGATLPPGLRDAVNLAYRQRRKVLRKTLAGVLASEETLVSVLADLGQPPGARPEDLEPEDWPRLWERIHGEAR
ncbi:MAG: ribosomal RNA small subunit methyltransferase A [Gemmatimonadota bacterium]|nr:MAG: ribosomal RNA small subunit methyltransferase A [Gemmatimonadota bacterium]